MTTKTKHACPMDSKSAFPMPCTCAGKPLPSYECARCLTRHELPKEIPYSEPPGVSWGDQPKEIRENRHARSLYREHRQYALGTERADALLRLREWIKPGDTVTITIPHVARSGMSRQMRIYGRGDGAALNFTYNIAQALGYPMVGEALRIGGCGMDMTFALVDELAHALWPNGYACPGVAKCWHPKRGAYNHETKECEPHARHHRADGNYSLRREVL